MLSCYFYKAVITFLLARITYQKSSSLKFSQIIWESDNQKKTYIHSWNMTLLVLGELIFIVSYEMLNL